MPSSVRYVTTEDGVQIAVTRSGTGRPLVFVRGWISNIDLLMQDPGFSAWANALTACFDVTRYDMRGNGLSDRDVAGRASLDDMVRDLEAVVDALHDEPVILLATCYGGPIAIRYAATHPSRVAALVLDGTFANLHMVDPAIRESVLANIRMFHTEPRAATAAIDYWTAPDSGDELRQDRMRRSRDSIDATVAEELYEESFRLDVSSEATEVHAPTLVMHRERNRAVPFRAGRQLAGLIPDARFAPLPGSAANPWEGDPIPGLEAIGDFLGVDLVSNFRAAVSSRLVAVLITDIVDSTRAAVEHGDQHARELMRVHERIISDVVRLGFGARTRSTGDGVLATFHSVSSALDAAESIRRELELHNERRPDLPLRVRAGIAVGEPVSEDDELYGLTVAVAARVCAEAGAEEIMVTPVVRELARGRPYSFRSTGLHELKGLDAPMELFLVEPPT